MDLLPDKGRVVFVSSPFGGKKENSQKAASVCHELLKKGWSPFAPHVYYADNLDDAVPWERELGMNAGLEILKKCDFILVMGDHMTHGMKMEIELATAMGKPVIFKSWTDFGVAERLSKSAKDIDK